jgi:D-glucuronyl C5-epimerase-like protein
VRSGSGRIASPRRPSGRIDAAWRIAAATTVLAFAAALWSATRDPGLTVPDNALYDATPRPIPCYAVDPVPTCPYVRPALSGVPSPRDTAEGLADRMAAALSSDSAGIRSVADDLVTSQVAGLWRYGTDLSLSSSTIHAPWSSAATQGLGISVLARAWAATPDARYRTAIAAAAAAMPVSPDGWPETLPDGSHALTGGLNAVFGLWDAWRVTRDEATKARFDRALAWLDANIQRFDRDFVVRYGLAPDDMPTSAGLLRYSIVQLRVLATLTGRDSLMDVANEWDWRITNPGAFRLNLYLQALARQPALWLALAVGTATAAMWITARRRRRSTPRRAPVRTAPS